MGFASVASTGLTPFASRGPQLCCRSQTTRCWARSSQDRRTSTALLRKLHARCVVSSSYRQHNAVRIVSACLAPQAAWRAAVACVEDPNVCYTALIDEQSCPRCGPLNAEGILSCCLQPCADSGPRERRELRHQEPVQGLQGVLPGLRGGRQPEHGRHALLAGELCSNPLNTLPLARQRPYCCLQF